MIELIEIAAVRVVVERVTIPVKEQIGNVSVREQRGPEPPDRIFGVAIAGAWRAGLLVA